MSLTYKIRSALILAIALPIAAVTAQAQRVNSIKPSAPATITLDGVVRDREGRALSAAEVLVDGEHRVITNSRGEFTIPGLPAGIVEFTARRIGYSPITTAVQVDPGVTAHLAVKLVPELGEAERKRVGGGRAGSERIGPEGRVRIVLGELAHVVEASLQFMTAAANGGDVTDVIGL